ncbi:MAG: hypothetical protein ABIH67_01460 [Candidatus Uhrbacteria bacterium]
MSKTPNYDAKIKTILDALEPGERVCELTGEKWDMTEEEISWYRKFNVPPSKKAPQTRMVIVAAFGNSFQWWYQKHPETGKQILTYAHPASGVRVLPDKEWFDQDFSKITQPFDKQKPTFEIVRKLELAIPFTASRNMKEPENSLCVVSLGDVNDTLMMACQARNSLFSIVLTNGESSAEVLFGDSVSNSYNISHGDRIHQCNFLRDSHDCINCSFLFDCRNCEDCFGAVNRRNAKYIFWEEQLSESEYRARMKEIDLSCRKSLDGYKLHFQKMVAEAIWPENFNVKAEGCVGEYLVNTTDCKYAYCCSHGPKNNYWTNFTFGQSEGNAFLDGGSGAINSYYSLGLSDSNLCEFCFGVSNCMNLEYCMQCYNCENCFGCVGLQRKKFCIFNKQYNEDEYWAKVDELKCAMLERGEYGEFFPLSFSSAYLPESTSVWLGVNTEEQARKLGANVFPITAEGAVGNIDSTERRTLEEIPDCVDGLSDEWIGKPIFDPEINRRFAFFPQEIQFYRKINLAPPARHFISRVKDLIAEANIAQYEETNCGQCNTSLTVAKNTTYKDRNIYCHECYLRYLETR